MVSFLTFLSSVLRAAGLFGHSTVDLSVVKDPQKSG
jgi:hypothetical protein